MTTRSWLGKEYHKLEEGLTELPGILNWSLAGLRRLTINNGNRFSRYAAADEAITTMQDLASPVGAFARERCVLEAVAKIDTDKLYDAYKTWAELGEYPKFEGQLRAQSAGRMSPLSASSGRATRAGNSTRRASGPPVFSASG